MSRPPRKPPEPPPPPVRPRRPWGRAWMKDHRGRPYRIHTETTGFQVMYQPFDGGLWSRLRGPEGRPLVLPRGFTRADFEAAVGLVPGSYQLVPCNDAGQQRGDPPERLDLAPADAPTTATDSERAVPVTPTEITALTRDRRPRT